MELADVELLPRGARCEDEQGKLCSSCPPKIKQSAASSFSTGDLLLEMESSQLEESSLPVFLEQQGFTRIRVPRRAEVRSRASMEETSQDEPMAALGSLGKLLAR
eukprot:752336-Hanusia_phi.AAC.1